MVKLEERTDIPVIDKIDISKDDWTKLKSKHIEVWIRDWLVTTIRKNKIPPPYTPYTEDEIRNEFTKLTHYDISQLRSDEPYYIKHEIK